MKKTLHKVPNTVRIFLGIVLLLVIAIAVYVFMLVGPPQGIFVESAIPVYGLYKVIGDTETPYTATIEGDYVVYKNREQEKRTQEAWEKVVERLQTGEKHVTVPYQYTASVYNITATTGTVRGFFVYQVRLRPPHTYDVITLPVLYITGDLPSSATPSLQKAHIPYILRGDKAHISLLFYLADNKLFANIPPEELLEKEGYIKTISTYKALWNRKNVYKIRVFFSNTAAYRLIRHLSRERLLYWGIGFRVLIRTHRQHAPVYISRIILIPSAVSVM